MLTKIDLVLLEVASILCQEIELKRGSKFCLQWSFIG